MSTNHWMLFSTFAEQDYFEYPQHGTYKGVIINANMASHAPAGLGAFLVEKTAAETQYLIDPLTHAFQHDPRVILNSKDKPKSSIVKLAESYGSPILDLLGRRPLLPKHFSDPKKLRVFVQKCLDFQRNQLADTMKNSDSAKYVDDIESEISPYALIAPYFFLNETSINQWIDINKSAANFAIDSLNSGEKCFGAVVISKGVLTSDDAFKLLLETYDETQFSGFVIWIDNLDEQTASKRELVRLLDLGTKLGRNGEREVINLHGGYFSILATGQLGNRALTGVAHAPEFGEFRPVVPVGGGIPISRYYIPELHTRVRFRDALRIFQSENWLMSVASFHDNVCDCIECQTTLDGNINNFTKFGDSDLKTIRRKHGMVRIDFPTIEARRRCLKHYLQRKFREYRAANDAPSKTLIANLKKGETKFQNVIGLDGVAHLKLWREIFSS